ncbi:permease [Gandjariella thermophila]|uniref:permease n=1 Tax=Gandjariella thermophila TaxID=1931992 RepID=UPI001CEF6D45|nr:permease [Gandjariella thermophila]
MTTATRAQPSRVRRRITSLEVLCALLVLALALQGWLNRVLDVPALRTGSTVFVAVCVQAMPFLVLGVLVSGAIAAFMPAAVLRRVLPRRTALAVPVAGAAGVALPGCECASVPVARRLMQQGVPPAVAVAFLLAAPAVNPIVLVATAVAFPGRPEMVLARFVGSLATAVVTGWLWARLGRPEWIAERALRRLPATEGGSRWAVFAETARHDLVESGGYLVIGGLTAAVLNVLVPSGWLAAVGGQAALGVLVMALLAVVLALCSEADAFVAASLGALPLLPRLVFLVVGPAVDVKLIALHAGTFGRSFAVRFAPLVFVVAVGCALAAGLVFLS